MPHPTKVSSILFELNQLNQAYSAKNIDRDTYLLEINRLILNHDLSDKTLICDEDSRTASWNIGCGGRWVAKQQAAIMGQSRRRGHASSSATSPTLDEEERIYLCKQVSESLFALGLADMMLFQEGPSDTYLRNNPQVRQHYLGIKNPGEGYQVCTYALMAKSKSLTPTFSDAAMAIRHKAIALGLDPKEYQIVETDDGMIYINVHFNWGEMYHKDGVTGVVTIKQTGLDNRFAFLAFASAYPDVRIGGDSNIRHSEYAGLIPCQNGVAFLNGGCDTMDVMIGNGVGGDLAYMKPTPPVTLSSSSSGATMQPIMQTQPTMPVQSMPVQPPRQNAGALRQQLSLIIGQIIGKGIVQVTANDRAPLIQTTLCFTNPRDADDLAQYLDKATTEQIVHRAGTKFVTIPNSVLSEAMSYYQQQAAPALSSSYATMQPIMQTQPTMPVQSLRQNVGALRQQLGLIIGQKIGTGRVQVTANNRRPHLDTTLEFSNPYDADDLAQYLDKATTEQIVHRAGTKFVTIPNSVLSQAMTYYQQQTAPVFSTPLAPRPTPALQMPSLKKALSNLGYTAESISTVRHKHQRGVMLMSIQFNNASGADSFFDTFVSANGIHKYGTRFVSFPKDELTQVLKALESAATPMSQPSLSTAFS